MNATMAEYCESKLIRILYRIKQIKDNAILEDLIKQLASKIKSVFDNAKKDLKQNWTDTETKKRANEEHQPGTSTKIRGVQDQSWNKLIDKSTVTSKSTIAKPSKLIILRRRLMMSLDSSYKVISGARAKNAFEDILKGKISFNEIRKAGLIDILS
ncbi:hypothetical protein ACOME3_004903 [Neoechinorhynchus agilis]